MLFARGEMKYNQASFLKAKELGLMTPQFFISKAAFPREKIRGCLFETVPYRVFTYFYQISIIPKPSRTDETRIIKSITGAIYRIMTENIPFKLSLLPSSSTSSITAFGFKK